MVESHLCWEKKVDKCCSYFVVVILTWWNKSIRLLETSSVGTSVDFNFMDGPYYVRAVKKDDILVSLSFIRRNKANLELITTLDVETDSLKNPF